MARVDTTIDRERLAWWVVAGGFVVILLFVVRSFLGTLVLSLFVYYATRPIHRRLVKRLRQPTLAALASLLGLAVPALVLVGYTVALAVRELQTLNIQGIAGLESIADLFPAVEPPMLDPARLLEVVRADPERVFQLGGSSLDSIVGSLLTALGALTSVLISVTVVTVVAFYLLRDGPRLAHWVAASFGGEDSVTVSYIRAVDRDLQIVYFGNLLTAFVIAVVAAVVYNLLNLVAPAGVAIPAPTLLGLLTGLASLVPVIGMKLVYVPVGVLLAIDAGLTAVGSLWFAAAFLIVAIVIVDTIPELLLRPYVSGRDLHMGLIMLAYILGPVLFGWYGLFLGPLLLVLLVHFVRLVLPDLVTGHRTSPLTVAEDSADAGPPSQEAPSGSEAVEPPPDETEISNETDQSTETGASSES